MQQIIDDVSYFSSLVGEFDREKGPLAALSFLKSVILRRDKITQEKCENSFVLKSFSQMRTKDTFLLNLVSCIKFPLGTIMHDIEIQLCSCPLLIKIS